MTTPKAPRLTTEVVEYDATPDLGTEVARLRALINEWAEAGESVRVADGVVKGHDLFWSDVDRALAALSAAHARLDAAEDALRAVASKPGGSE